MNKFTNRKKNTFIDSIPIISLDSDSHDIVNRCKFNFSYFDSSQKAGQDFSDWTQDQLSKLLTKLKEYSRQPLSHWKTVKIGSGKHRNSILIEYVDFPKKSDFKFPKYVPHQVSWARFRLEQSVRLIGFIIPSDYKDKEIKKYNWKFDCNTFYVVFLDKNHKFYLTS